VFAATLTVTVPEPVPLAGFTVTHADALDAAHPQVVRFAVTATPLVAPVAAADNELADSA
jgi:hypothetical protein